MVVEGPLGATLTESEELTVLAASKGVQIDVGLQGRADPLIIKSRRLLIRGTIGRVTRSVTTSYTLQLQPQTDSKSGYLRIGAEC